MLAEPRFDEEEEEENEGEEEAEEGWLDVEGGGRPGTTVEGTLGPDAWGESNVVVRVETTGAGMPWTGKLSSRKLSRNQTVSDKLVRNEATQDFKF